MTQRLKVDLSDGRALEYTPLGAATGPLVVVLDGPRSRGLARAMSPAAEVAGIRLVAPDRPAPCGFQEWAGLHEAMLDTLEVDRAGIVGQSGGTPFALAAAGGLGDRVTGLSLLGAFWAPWERGGKAGLSSDMKISSTLGRRAPGLLSRLMRNVAKDPGKAAQRVVDQAPQSDRKLLEQPELLAIHQESTREILAAPDELAAEIAQLSRPWDLDLASIRCPVELWSGDHDRAHPTSMSNRLAERLGGAPVHVIEGAGTFGLLPHYPAALRFAAGTGD